eukprot:355224_1
MQAEDVLKEQRKNVIIVKIVSAQSSKINFDIGPLMFELLKTMKRIALHFEFEGKVEMDKKFISNNAFLQELKQNYSVTWNQSIGQYSVRHHFVIGNGSQSIKTCCNWLLRCKNCQC